MGAGMTSTIGPGQPNGYRNLENSQVPTIAHSLNPYEYNTARTSNSSVLQNLSATAQQQVTDRGTDWRAGVVRFLY